MLGMKRMLSAALIRLTNQQGDNYHTLCATDTEVRAEKAGWGISEVW